MTAEETFNRRVEELDEIAISPSGEVVPRLRILPAEEPPARIGIGTIIALTWLLTWAGLRVITFLLGRYL